MLAGLTWLLGCQVAGELRVVREAILASLVRLAADSQ